MPLDEKSCLILFIKLTWVHFQVTDFPTSVLLAAASHAFSPAVSVQEMLQSATGVYNSSKFNHRKTGLNNQRRWLLKFQIKKVEGLYYPSNENKDSDQLRG